MLNSSLPGLAKHLSFLIQWLDKEEVVRNMQIVFHGTYSKCHVVIDCTEVFIECLGNLTARSVFSITSYLLVEYGNFWAMPLPVLS